MPSTGDAAGIHGGAHLWRVGHHETWVHSSGCRIRFAPGNSADQCAFRQLVAGPRRRPGSAQGYEHPRPKGGEGVVVSASGSMEQLGVATEDGRSRKPAEEIDAPDNGHKIKPYRRRATSWTLR
jgi:hypothetical protein